MQINNGAFITQKTFRALLQAMSHPGRVYTLSQESDGLMLILQTLLDHEVGFCVIGREKEYLETTISELTRCPVKDIPDADFIIVSDGESNGEILKAKRGTLEYTDTGATAIFSIHSLSVRDNGGLCITLNGPGINGEISPFISGISKKEFDYLKEINSEFPLGIDCIFIDTERRIMCIPRSTRIEVK